MKKGLFVFAVCFFSFIVRINAECTYSDLVELNTLASHVKYTYEFDDTAQRFNVKFNNVVDGLVLEYFEQKYNATNNSVVLYSILEGANISVSVTTSVQSSCPLNLLRVMNITIPYLNTFYNSNFCEGYNHLPICNTKFLNYEITYDVFQNILNKQIKQSETIEEKPIEEDDTPEKAFFDIVLDFFKKHWLEGTLLLGTSLLTFTIGSLVYRKIKYKL